MLLLSEWLSNIIYVFAYFMTLLVLIVFHYNFVLFDILLLRNTFDIAINMKHLSRELWTSGLTYCSHTRNIEILNFWMSYNRQLILLAQVRCGSFRFSTFIFRKRDVIQHAGITDTNKDRRKDRDKQRQTQRHRHKQNTATNKTNLCLLVVKEHIACPYFVLFI